MSPSMRAQPAASRRIAGGFILVPARQLLRAWRACREDPLGVGDFRAWLACREMLARRCLADPGRSPAYGLAELAGLAGVSPKRAGASVARLVAAGLLAWSDGAIAFPEPEAPDGSDDDALGDTIGRGEGSLAIPRRVLRFLAAGARPALIATVLAVLLRCLSRGKGGFKSRGRLKASWVALAFGVDLRRVKQARKELVALGWIEPEPADRWAENRWGRIYHIDLDWAPAGVGDAPGLPPPPAPGGRRLPPPDLDPEPLREVKNQEPAPGGPAGVRIGETGGGEGPRPSLAAPETMGTSATAPGLPVPPVLPPAKSPKVTHLPPRPTDATSPRRVGPLRPDPARPTSPNGSNGTSLPAPTLNDVRAEDLRDTGRLLVLLAQAIAAGLVGPSEADRLRFVAAAEHAMAAGRGNPPGLFIYLVRGGLWRYLTGEDEGRASRRLGSHLSGASRCGVVPVPRPGCPARHGPSGDARVVGELRRATIRAGILRDPFPAFAAMNPDWTRERWDAALAELAGS